MVSSRFLTLYCKYFIGDKCKYLGIKNKQKKFVQAYNTRVTCLMPVTYMLFQQLVIVHFNVKPSKLFQLTYNSTVITMLVYEFRKI